VLALVTVLYTLLLVWAGGPGYLLLTFLVYAPASVLHVVARRQDGGLLPAERIACAAVVVLGVVAATALATGLVTL
jgi:arginine:ornithine antiporter / lysine permease